MTITERIAARLDAIHIAMHDPADVLALVDGLRAVVALHRPASDVPDHCGTCGDPYWWDQTPPEPWPCPTLTALAAVLDPVGEGSEGAEAAGEVRNA